MINKLFLSLGSNIEPKLSYLTEAIRLLNAEFDFVSASAVYRTAPVDYTAQEDFYNLCAEYETDNDDPFVVFEIIKGIEKKIGREKTFDKGPRKIDIDIIIFGEHSVNSEALNIPHREFLNRRFVLEPLMELLPEDSEYIKKYDLVNRLNSIGSQPVIKIGELKIDK